MICNEGIVYCIKSRKDGRVYVGTTTQSLEKALISLKSYAKNARNVSSNQIIKGGDFKIDVLAKYSNITPPDLKKKMGIFQKKFGDKCVNIQNAGRTQKQMYQEKKESLKKMYLENKENICRNSAIQNMRRRGRPPTLSTIKRYKISSQEIAKYCKVF